MSHIQLNRQPPRRPRVLFGKTHYVQGKTPRFTGVYIGLLDEEHMELLQNRKLKELTPEMQECLRRRGISFGKRLANPPGRRPSLDKPMRLSELHGVGYEEVGIFRVLRHLASCSGLTQSLQAAFGAVSDNMFTLACYLTAENRGLYLTQLWVDKTPFEKVGFSSSTISRLLGAVGANVESRLNFHRNWYKACGSPKSLIHDTTSISGYSTSMKELDWGYNRDGEKLPQINMASVYALKLHLPLFYRALPGSIPDIASFIGTNDYMDLLDIHDYQYVIDRGYFSDANIKDMLARGLDFTIGARWNNRLLGLLRRNAGVLHSGRAKSILHNGQRILWIRGEYLLERDDSRSVRKKLTAYVFYNPIAAHEHMQKLENEIEGIVQESRMEHFSTAKEAHAWVEAKHNEFSSCLIEISEATRKRSKGSADGLGVLLERSARGILNYGEKFGASVVVTSLANQDATDTFEQYYSRDPIEKMYDILKNELEYNRLYTGKDSIMEGRLFIAFLGTIIHIMIENKLRERGLLKSISVREAFALLAKVGCTRLNNGKELKHDIPKKTCDLINGLGFQRIFNDYREFKDMGKENKGIMPTEE